ncbi:MAG: protein translocase subunit SecD, partial [Bdellovibrionales bacterium]
MVYLARWKVILIIAVCTIGILYALPNAMNRQTREWIAENLPGFVPHEAVNLGLDLRGGSYLLLDVAVDSVIEERLQGLVDQTRMELRGANIGYADLGVSGGAVRFRLTDPSKADAARQKLREMDSELEISDSGDTFNIRMSEAKIIERKRLA